jgi:hypothetical protein
MPMTPLGPIYSPQEAGQALKRLAAQNSLLSSPFIRWLLERERVLDLSGLLDAAEQRLAALRAGQGPRPELPQSGPSALVGPGMSFEAAPPVMFSDLMGRLQSLLANRTQPQPHMVPPSIRDRVFPPSQRLIPPGPTLPGRPF